MTASQRLDEFKWNQLAVLRSLRRDLIGADAVSSSSASRSITSCKPDIQSSLISSTSGSDFTALSSSLHGSIYNRVSKGSFQKLVEQSGSESSGKLGAGRKESATNGVDEYPFACFSLEMSFSKEEIRSSWEWYLRYKIWRRLPFEKGTGKAVEAETSLPILLAGTGERDCSFERSKSVLVRTKVNSGSLVGELVVMHNVGSCPHAFVRCHASRYSEAS